MWIRDEGSTVFRFVAAGALLCFAVVNPILGIKSGATSAETAVLIA